MPFLCQIRANGEAIDRWKIGDKPVVVGRGGRADVRVQDEQVSREHFAIVQDGNGFVIYDLNSKNGTWVNGHRVARQELTANERIRAGRTLLRFEEGLNSVISKLAGREDHATELML